MIQCLSEKTNWFTHWRFRIDKNPWRLRVLLVQWRTMSYFQRYIDCKFRWHIFYSFCVLNLFHFKIILCNCQLILSCINMYLLYKSDSKIFKKKIRKILFYNILNQANQLNTFYNILNIVILTSLGKTISCRENLLNSNWNLQFKKEQKQCPIYKDMTTENFLLKFYYIIISIVILSYFNMKYLFYKCDNNIYKKKMRKNTISWNFESGVTIKLVLQYFK